MPGFQSIQELHWQSLLDHFGVTVAAITGVLAARGKEVDLFGVIVLAFDDVTTGKSAQASQPLRWSFSAGVLTFTSFSGIAGTDVYRLRVLVMEA